MTAVNFQPGLSIVGIFIICSLTHAAVTSVPPDLHPGDQYRLVFVTSDTRRATTFDITAYNTFVQAAANTNQDLAALGVDWTAIASTPAIDARDNTGTNPGIDGVGVPIYLLDGGRVADSYVDLWDGAIQRPISVDEWGVDSHPPASRFVWTGTLSDGVVSGFPLGGDMLGLAMLGDMRDISDWVELRLIDNNTKSYPLYGLSAPLSIVPEPTAFTLSLIGFATIGLVTRRRTFARR